MARTTPALQRLSQDLLRQNEAVESSVDALAKELTAACPRGTSAWQRVVDGGEFLRRGSRARTQRVLRHKPAK